MFGYVKPYIPKLTVEQHEAYRATYCGLCRTMGRLTGQLSRFTLNYDFVFLALLRMLIEGEPSCFDRKICIAHPLSKRTYMKQNNSLLYSAAACAILTKGKINDNIADEKGFKKTAAEIALPFESMAVSRLDKKYSVLEEKVTNGLKALEEIEKQKTASIDIPAEAFGKILGEICSFGLESKKSRIAYEIGFRVGKIIYIADCADDMEKDIKDEKYNPIALIYENPAEYSEKAKKQLLRREIADGLFVSAGLEACRAMSALQLIECDNAEIYRGILENMLTLGIRSMISHILYGTKLDTNPLPENFADNLK